MDPINLLQQVLESVRDGRADAARAAQLAPGWSPARYPSFLDYLNACGALDHRKAAAAGSNGVAWGENAATVTALSPGTPRVAGRSTTVSLDGVGDECPPTLPYPPGGHSPPIPVGSSGGRYRPIRLHKTGGLGQVWLAHDTVLGRDVALKVVRPERAGRADLAARFLREARVTGCLEHPGIVPLYDLVEGGEAWGSGPCYVMRYVSGGTLAEAMARYHARLSKSEATPLEFRTLLDAFVAVCQAVAFAHARGVLHRDLKGQNVVLGEFGEVFLVDWGLTKLTGRPGDGLYAGDGADETAEGTISGTPAYMAPEVAAGAESTTASDVYGLGAMLYAVLTGKAPAEGTTPQEVIEKVCSSDPTPPRDVNPAASRALEAVCRKAMARQPANRYAGAAELATDVQRWLADEPVLALREPWPDRAARWARRHRPAVAATATTVLTVVVALSVSTALLWTEERKTAAQKVAADEQRDRADEQAKTAQKQQGRAEANLDTAHALTLKLVYATEKLLPPVNGSEMARLELSRAAAGAFRSFSEQRPETPEARRTNAELSRIEANLCRLVGDADGAEKAYASAIEALRGDEVSELRFAETLRDYAYLQHITGRPVAALATLQKAQVVVDQLRKREPGRNAFKRVAATVYLDRAYAETTVGRYPDALASCDLAIALYRELLTLDTNPLDYESTLFLAASLTQKAMAARESHNWPGAATLLTEAKATLKPLIGPGRKFPSVNADDALFWQAMSVYEECRNRAESGDYKTPAPEKNLETVVLRFTDLSTRHSRIPHYRGWLGKSLLALGRAREARAKSAEAAQDYQADYQAALLHFERLVKDCPAFPEYQADLGRACLGQAQATAADPAAARAWHDRGTAALRAALAASPDDAEIKRDIAGLTRPADR